MKIIALILIPVIVSLCVGIALYSITGDFEGLFTHDILEAHTHAALIPFITLIAVSVGFIPCFVYMANVLFPLNRAECEAVAAESAHVLSATPETLRIGQIFTAAGSNCQVRVKALKSTVFVGADLSNYEYLLNFSL